MVDWKTRISNKSFWMTLIPAVFVMIKLVLEAVECGINMECLEPVLLKIVTAVFSILAVLGVVNDPTTPGITDPHVKGMKDDTTEK